MRIRNDVDHRQRPRLQALEYAVKEGVLWCSLKSFALLCCGPF
jgi:hypothetical protein